MINDPIYMVPFDFSEFSDNALNLALDLARSNNGAVFLLNIVKDKSGKAKVRRQYHNVLDGLSAEDRKRVVTRIVVGNVYDEIGKASEILRPNLIVMGTHGAKGAQKLFGSHVEKIIHNSASPLLITRGDHSVESLKSIVMPFDFSKESLKITKFTSDMAKKFGACIHLVGHHDNNEMHEEAIEKNQLIVERYLAENKIDFKIIHLPLKKDFDSELLDYSGSIHADMIAASYSNDSMVISNSHMQRIIENIYRIPVLTVNAEELA